jgi:hypothetical protein
MLRFLKHLLRRRNVTCICFIRVPIVLQVPKADFHVAICLRLTTIVTSLVQIHSEEITISPPAYLHVPPEPAVWLRLDCITIHDTSRPQCRDCSLFLSMCVSADDVKKYSGRKHSDFSRLPRFHVDLARYAKSRATTRLADATTISGL